MSKACPSDGTQNQAVFNMIKIGFHCFTNEELEKCLSEDNLKCCTTEVLILAQGQSITVLKVKNWFIQSAIHTAAGKGQGYRDFKVCKLDYRTPAKDVLSIPELNKEEILAILIPKASK